MKYEEYEQKLSECVKNPDSAALAIQDILKELKTDCETMASLEAGIAEKDGRIRDLQDTNMKLFLQNCSGAPDQDEAEPVKLSFGEKLEQLESNGGK